MKNQDTHSPRSFVFRPGEHVNISITKKGAKTSTRVSVLEGLAPFKKSVGKLEFRRPKTGVKQGRIQVQTLFDHPEKTLHKYVGSVEILLTGSSGTSYRHEVRPGPTRASWYLNIMGVEPGGARYYCNNPECPKANEGLGSAPPNMVCPHCHKGQLTKFTF